ncbi:MAG: hypothetical protein A2Y33_15140 [Spirochaetes bacterium GWF1_51_8]|nr:MAG: hypothetical protein A2Y33_15140 [Spirochaetes bacterium GWF1_51_8]
MLRVLYPVLFIALIVQNFFGLQFIQPYIDGNKVIFSFIASDEKVGTCALVGSFNGWDGEKSVFAKKGAQLYTVSVALQPGRYEYQFVIDGRWISDSGNPLTVGDGFGGVNSVLYINKNKVIDWNHTDRYDPVKEYQKILHQSLSPLYSVQLKGNYRINMLELFFTNLQIIFSNGIVRLAETKAGVTGIAVWGDTVIVSREDEEVRTNFGKGVFMRFNPVFFAVIQSNLQELRIQPNSAEEMDFVNCNNIFYLKKSRFYNNNELFLIPPEGFVGISLNDEKYKKEDIYVIQDSYYKDELLQELSMQPKVQAIQAKQKDAKLKYGKVANTILKAWIKAVSTSDQSYIKQYLALQQKNDGFVLMGLFNDKHFEGITLLESTIRVTEPVALSAELYDVMDSTSVFIVTCEFVEKNKKTGNIRLLIGRVNGEWKILNFEIEG